METNLNKILSDSKYTELFQNIDLHYPRVTERIANLSITGINPRTFYHWKNEGLIDYFEDQNEIKRTWVRLNIFEFVWLKIIQTTRNFGLTISSLKELKEYSFLDIYDEISEDPELYKNFKKEILNEEEENIEKELSYIDLIQENKKNELQEDKILRTLISSIIFSVILTETDASLIITNRKESFDFCYVVFDQTTENVIKMLDVENQPHLNIPIRPIIKEFLEEPKNDKNLDYWGFIRKDERRILEAIRNKNFQELHLKRKNNQEDFIIEATFEKDVMDEKAKEIRRILGMNAYSEVNVKFRNDKHLFVKNKMKI
jgi:hypothetical protein